MADHRATIHWQHVSGNFRQGTYSRLHRWSFDGGVTMVASPSPHNVPVPYSDPSHVDPEEAYVASIASCHMLTFLYLAYRSGFDVIGYRDEAVGCMTKEANGVEWISRVELRPVVTYGGDPQPTPAEVRALHEAAHEQCFIANSVKTSIEVCL